MSFVALFICCLYVGISYAQGPEATLLNAWVNTQTANSVWNTSADYCTWAGFTCDGSGNLLTINYTCPAGDSFYATIPPLDVWANSTTAFQQTTLIKFTNCIVGFEIPAFMTSGAYYNVAPFFFTIGTPTPWLNCPLPSFFSSGSQGLTCSDAGIVSITPYHVSPSGGSFEILVNKASGWIGAQCQLLAPTTLLNPDSIAFSLYTAPNFTTPASTQTTFTCTAPAHAAGRVPVRIVIGSTVVTQDALFLGYDCPFGYYSMNASQPCTPCPVGTYQDQPYADGQTCLPCPVGTFASKTGSITCGMCAEGYTTFGNTGSISCSQCPPGTLSNADRSGCDGCPAGQYASSPASTNCSECSYGFGSVEGSGECQLCKAGTYSSSFNLTGGECVECGYGFYSEVDGAIMCQSCQDGYTTSNLGSNTSADCNQCVAGTARRKFEVGSSYANGCEPCIAGYYAPYVGMVVCFACPRGWFNTDIGSTNCTRCPNGTDNGAPGSTECIDGFVMKSQEDFGGRIIVIGEPVDDINEDDRTTAGIVLLAFGGSFFVIGILILIVAGIFQFMKFKELQAISAEIEKLKDLQNNRL